MEVASKPLYSETRPSVKGSAPATRYQCFTEACCSKEGHPTFMLIEDELNASVDNCKWHVV